MNIDLKRRLKWLYQRLTRGFDDRETWSLDCTIAKFAIPRLIVLRDRQFGYPACLGDDGEPIWFAILDKIIQSLQFIADFSWDEPGHQDYTLEGLDLLSEYFLSLWD